MTVLGIRQFQGVSREDAEMILKAAKEMEKIWTSTDADGSVFDAACRPILKIMCREISKQKKRLGGSFAVAHAVVTRYVICSILAVQLV